MAILTRAKLRSYTTSSGTQLTAKQASEILSSHKAVTASRESFDVFLSHRYADKIELANLMQMMADSKISVFVDWKERPELERESVTKHTAATLKNDMRRCGALLFVITSTASSSRWMPWELGLFDGMNGRVATVPLATIAGEFPGQEYAGLYPWVDVAAETGGRNNVLWVNESENRYTTLKNWLEGVPCKPH